MTYDETVRKHYDHVGDEYGLSRRARWQTISRAELRLTQFYPSFCPPRRRAELPMSAAEMATRSPA